MTETRPYADPAKPGFIDADGVEWWACDPYPTWYRWANGKLKTTVQPKTSCRWSGARGRWEWEIRPGVSKEACNHDHGRAE